MRFAAAAGLHAEILPSLPEARDDWNRLAERSGNVFATWEWATVWWKHFGGGAELLAVLWRDDAGEPVVLLPLHVSRRGPLRLVRFLGYGPGDELGPICAAESRSVAAAALNATLAGLGRSWHAFLGERLPASPAWGAIDGVSAVSGEASPVLSLAGRTWEEILAGRSSNFRQQVRRRERRLAKAGDLRFRLTTAETLQADMDALVHLHGARWGDEASGAFAPERRSFHEEWAAAALRQGWLRMWVLELDGRAAAVWYGFRFAQGESYYQSGRDPERDRDSVGFVLLVHTIREAAGDGMLEYRFLRGGEAYKDRFADGDAQLETVLAARSRPGQVVCRAVVGVQDRAPQLRRLLGSAAGRS
jgi:CelD/BcsL family acetyltransferase involved in cellulose biosynthesis